MKKFKLGIIGMGNMATAITSGIINSFFLDKKDICFYDVDKIKAEEKAKRLKVNICNDFGEIFSLAEYILLAFKPQNLKDNTSKIRKYFDVRSHVLLSLLAGITINNFEKIISEKAKIARIMPNAPVLINKGMSAISFNSNILPEQKDFVIKMFACFGSAVSINERYQNLAIALSGSSPAYFYLICKYMVDFAVGQGLDKETAKKLAAGSITGSGEVLKQTNDDFNDLIGRVASKGGTTEKALESFEKNNLKKIIFDAMTMVLKKALEIEKSA